MLDVPFWIEKYYMPAELDVYITFSPKFESAERSITVNAKLINSEQIKPAGAIIYWRLGSPESKKEEEKELAEKALLLHEKDSIFWPVVLVVIGPIMIIVFLCCLRQRRLDKERKASELVQLTKEIEKWHYATLIAKMSRHEIKLIEKKGGR